jgi:hypothetical protein
VGSNGIKFFSTNDEVSDPDLEKNRISWEFEGLKYFLNKELESKRNLL